MECIYLENKTITNSDTEIFVKKNEFVHSVIFLQDVRENTNFCSSFSTWCRKITYLKYNY